MRLVVLCVHKHLMESSLKSYPEDTSEEPLKQAKMKVKINIQSVIPVVVPSMYKYRSLPKERSWGEYLTRLPKGISPHLTTKEHSCHVYSDSTPSKQIFGQIIKCNGTISHFEAKSWWHTALSEQHHVTLWCPPRLTMSVFAKKVL